MRFGLLLKPGRDAFIGLVGFDGGRELFAGDAANSSSRSSIGQG